jgi:Uma2 family endonuclease
LCLKLSFYNRYGIEEYYLYDPQHNELSGWQRIEGFLEVIETMSGWVSPRLGVSFELGEEGLEIYRPDGQKFLSYLELEEQKQLAQEQAERETQRAEKLAAKLRELNIDPDSI